ncbi:MULTISPECIES: helix-turn-helix domain-containing protein [unclassified Ruegeria]|uniref:AraC family transcriptional regulator n=1 Tax=unclassified Ruegeria TaxID=2625375 RepID=UPI001490BF07|nr:MULTISPECIES: helix-turn-helix domain-containing protein [unclassified Ruegeria]NOD78846.1 helix-turn-helix domain-containing protein [Ruegeria sp. HKCCD4332]UUV08499.1 helix-turn-helix domain-containing protein [Ruegeria sp. YS9]
MTENTTNMMADTVRVLPVNGIEAMQEGVKGASVEPTQLGKGAVRGKLTFADLGGSDLTIGRLSGSLAINGPLSQDRLVLGVLLEANDTSRQWSTSTRTGDVGVFPAMTEHASRYSGQSGYLTISADLDDIRERAKFHEIRLPRKFWRRGQMYRGSINAMRHLLKTSQSIEAALTDSRHSISIPSAAASARREIIDAFLYNFDGAVGLEQLRHVAFRDPQRVVRQAQEYIWQHSHRAVSLEEICGDLRLSGRSLHRAFHSVLDISPAAYARNWRLTQVRRHLAQSNGADVSVTEIATRFGFWELGRFSAQFRALFGELPSQVLARQ